MTFVNIIKNRFIEVGCWGAGGGYKGFLYSYVKENAGACKNLKIYYF